MSCYPALGAQSSGWDESKQAFRKPGRKPPNKGMQLLLISKGNCINREGCISWKYNMEGIHKSLTREVTYSAGAGPMEASKEVFDLIN